MSEERGAVKAALLEDSEPAFAVLDGEGGLSTLNQI